MTWNHFSESIQVIQDDPSDIFFTSTATMASLTLKVITTTSPCLPVMRHIFPLHNSSGPRTGTSAAAASETVCTWLENVEMVDQNRSNKKIDPRLATSDVSEFKLPQLQILAASITNIWMAWALGPGPSGWINALMFILISLETKALAATHANAQLGLETTTCQGRAKTRWSKTGRPFLSNQRMPAFQKCLVQVWAWPEKITTMSWPDGVISKQLQLVQVPNTK